MGLQCLSSWHSRCSCSSCSCERCHSAAKHRWCLARAPASWQGRICLCRLLLYSDCRPSVSETGQRRDLIGFQDPYCAGNNSFTGTLEETIPATYLEQLHVEHNMLTGYLPASLANAKNLTDLDTNGTMLTSATIHSAGVFTVCIPRMSFSGNGYMVVVFASRVHLNMFVCVPVANSLGSHCRNHCLIQPTSSKDFRATLCCLRFKQHPEVCVRSLLPI